MGAIRGVLLVVVSVLLFVSLFVGNIFLILSLSLQYENVQGEIVSIVEEVVEEIEIIDIVNDKLASMHSYCENDSEYVFSEQGYTFVIPCDVVSEGIDAIIEEGINNLVEEIYYKDYDCGFWDCFEKTGSPFFLISEKAKNYWNSKFYFSLIASVILIVLIFLLVEKKSNLFMIAGGLLIISSLPLMKIDWALSFISGESFLEFLIFFFAKAHTVFLMSFITGIIILSIGILLKLFRVGFKISNIFSKKNKKISKSEIKQIVKKDSSKKVKGKKSK